jgi:uncharacterized protein (TIGR02145 family)
MNKNVLAFIAILMLWFCGSLSAQSVSNVTAEQVGKTIHVSYNLDKQAHVTLFLSTDGGKTYKELHKVDGAVGKNVNPGQLTIVWNVLDEVENLQGNNFVFKVKAEPLITLPVVSTGLEVVDIKSTSAVIGGFVSSDGGASIERRGFCWSTATTPTESDAHSTNGRGTGGFSATITGLNPNTTYYVRAYATNSKGTGYGKEITFKTKKDDSFICGVSTLRDYDGNAYNTVLIGEQCWMKENLRTTHYADGEFIMIGADGGNSYTIAYRCYPDNNSNNVATYGYNYNWRAVMRKASSSSANPSGVQGICPTGWHVPSRTEWNQLINFVKDLGEHNVAKALASNAGWNKTSQICNVGHDQRYNNATGFSAFPAGMNSRYFGNDAFFWSSTARSSLADAYVSVLYMTYDKCSVYMRGEDSDNACSVRCLKD